MTDTRIHLLTSIQGFILLVFYCDDGEVWQFRVISGSAVFGERRIYYSATAAEKAGRAWIDTGT
jgi:hypothetical protein